MADQIPALVAQLDNADESQEEGISRQIDKLMIRELRATMRAITASAFAIDAFYATVTERCGPHPHREKWRKKRTSRKQQITETFHHHLHITKHDQVKRTKSCVSQVFRFRDRAVHMKSEFKRICTVMHRSATAQPNAKNYLPRELPPPKPLAVGAPTTSDTTTGA
jgi:hypothetical protein